MNEAVKQAIIKTPEPPDETHMDRPRYVRAVVDQNRTLAAALNELRTQHKADLAKAQATIAELKEAFEDACKAQSAAKATIQQRERELEEAHDTLRSLASWVGNGGYNAPSVDAKQFEAKIRDGVDHLINVEVNRALSDADTRAHAWWAHTGPHKSLREAIHNGLPAWARHSARAQQAEAKKEG